MEQIQSEITKVEFVSSCVGMQHRPKSIHRQICEDGDFMQHLTIVPEPSNKYDPLAMSVLYRGSVLGYIPKTDTDGARDFQAYLRGFSKVKQTWEITESKFMADNETPQWFAFIIKVECSI